VAVWYSLNQVKTEQLDSTSLVEMLEALPTRVGRHDHVRAGHWERSAAHPMATDRAPSEKGRIGACDVSLCLTLLSDVQQAGSLRPGLSLFVSRTAPATSRLSDAHDQLERTPSTWPCSGGAATGSERVERADGFRALPPRERRSAPSGADDRQNQCGQAPRARSSRDGRAVASAGFGMGANLRALPHCGLRSAAHREASGSRRGHRRHARRIRTPRQEVIGSI
jgi:hypothetical protein